MRDIAETSGRPVDPAVVVVAYDRPRSLTRLLRSIARAALPTQTQLIISVDEGHAESVAVAEQFDPGSLKKQIIARDKRLGLKAHVLACGDLSGIHGSVILLEDDLFVSQYFYGFAQQALPKYAGDARIGGVSLYRYQIAESCQQPFSPLEHGDVHFIQFPSSWGQAWTAGQWQAFRSWLSETDPGTIHLPAYIRAWQEPTWKRLFAAYLIATGRYFVYPPYSLSTNFGEAGQHFTARQDTFQAPLAGADRAYSFVDVGESRSVYDAFFELEPRSLNRSTDALCEFDYDVDLYGAKDEEFLVARHVLTRRVVDKALRRFAERMVPPVNNVVHGIEGDQIALCERSKIAHAPLPSPDLRRPEPSVTVIVDRAAKELRLEFALEAEPEIEVGLVLAPDADPELSTRELRTAGRLLGFVAAGGPANEAGAIAQVMENAHAPIAGYLGRGRRYRPGALATALAIFRDRPEVKWIVAHPAPAFARSPMQLTESRWRSDESAILWRRAFWLETRDTASAWPPTSLPDLWAVLHRGQPVHIVVDSWTTTPPAEVASPAASVAISPGLAMPPYPVHLGRERLGELASRLARLPGLARIGQLARLLPYLVIHDTGSDRFILWFYPRSFAKKAIRR